MQFPVAVDDLPAQDESREGITGFSISPVESLGVPVQLNGLGRHRRHNILRGAGMARETSALEAILRALCKCRCGITYMTSLTA